jgi:UDP-N-acetylmuramoylalanine--D-glutamate ligase
VNYKEFFKDKKIAVIGLGPHGEMVTDIKFLLKNSKSVSIYDIRSEKRLKNISSQIESLGLEKIVLGKIREEDLLTYDLIVLSLEISKKSSFLKKAIEVGIQIEYPETLFYKLAPQVTLVGVVGEYGKTTVTYLLHGIFKKGFAQYEDQGLFLIDPDSSNGVLSHLKKIKKGDVVIARIPDTLLPHLYQIRISPHVAVVISPTSFEILQFQTYNNFIVAPDFVVDKMKSEENFLSKAKILRTRDSLVGEDWGVPKFPIYNYENIALAIQTSELFKIPTDIVKQIVQTTAGLKGRIEFVKKVGNIEFYNDASSVTPSSTLAALKSLALKDQNKNIILIMGGAYTGYDYTSLIKSIPEYVKALILISGSGVIGLRQDLKESGINMLQAMSLDEAIIKAKEIALKGDRILYSPAFEALGVDISRRERSEKFVKAVRGL